MTIALTPRAREADSFELVLKGWSAIDPSRPIAIPLFRPTADSSSAGRFAVLSDRNISIEPASTAGEEPPKFRVDWGSPPVDWIWPTRKPTADQGLVWLRSESNPETLPIRATVRPRTIRLESTLTALVDRKGAEVVDEVSGEVSFGTLSRLDVAIPRDLPARLDIEGVEVASRDLLETEADGTRRYRLRFAREYADAFRIRFRYRQPFAELPADGKEGMLRAELDPGPGRDRPRATGLDLRRTRPRP